MRIEEEKIVEVINRLYEAGHPDPAGFIARAEIKTGLDFDKEYKGAVGTFGVNEKQALGFGYEKEDLFATDANLAAAIDVDMSNYRQADGDLDEMYRKGNSGSKASTERFVKKLDRTRKGITNRFIFNEGQLVGFRNKRSEDDASDTRSVDKRDGKVVYKEIRRTKTAEDIKTETNSYEFQTADKERVDAMLKKLVGFIVDEAPING